MQVVPKPDGSLRAVGDFRELNDKTELDGYPLPNLRNFTAQLKGAKVFSRVDLCKAFHQVPLDLDAQKKCTIITQWGAWQYKRLPMGLKNSAQSFQRLMDTTMAGMENVFVYMDDILVFNSDVTSHKKTLTEVFTRLEKAGLAISTKKCLFGESELEFVGYEVNSKGIKPINRKLTAITKFPTPVKQKQLLGYLGAIN